MKIKVYHISLYKHKSSIEKHGLIPKPKTCGSIRYGPSIFVSTIECDPVAFWYVNCDYFDCWVFLIDKNELIQDPFSPEKNHFYITKPIPPDELKLVYEGE